VRGPLPSGGRAKTSSDLQRGQVIVLAIPDARVICFRQSSLIRTHGLEYSSLLEVSSRVTPSCALANHTDRKETQLRPYSAQSLQSTDPAMSSKFAIGDTVDPAYSNHAEGTVL
jgi:hypothetical protein